MSHWSITLNNKVIKNFSIDEGKRVVIGRGSDADIVIDNTAISRHHTAFEIVPGACFIEDLGSLNGTFVNGNKISSRTQVSEKDNIQIGKFRLSPVEADGGKFALSRSSSVEMDMDEETVFVSQKKLSAEQKASMPGKGGHQLTVIGGRKKGTVIGLDGLSSIKIGKDITCDLVVTGWFIARAQCYIINREGKLFIVPQRSWAATKINGVKIKNEVQLTKGDIIEMSSHKIRFE
ncbi:MAG: FHA domain-containing protein [Desulfobulbaceae bacterium]|nr:FHA domain-containing protein [Desulfobulbaceae bacterium]